MICDAKLREQPVINIVISRTSRTEARKWKLIVTRGSGQRLGSGLNSSFHISSPKFDMGWKHQLGTFEWSNLTRMGGFRPAEVYNWLHQTRFNCFGNAGACWVVIGRNTRLNWTFKWRCIEAGSGRGSGPAATSDSGSSGHGWSHGAWKGSPTGRRPPSWVRQPERCWETSRCSTRQGFRSNYLDVNA